MDASHVRCTEEDFKRNLDVIILRTTTERYLVYVKDKFIFQILFWNLWLKTLKYAL